MSSTIRYDKLQQAEEGSAAAEGTATPNQRPWHRLLLLVGKTVLVLLALNGLVSAIQPVATTFFPVLTGSFHPYIKWGWIHTQHRPSCRCGATLTEAKANGCNYDSHALAWLPPHCQDQELLAEWEHAGSGVDGQWEYYGDKNGTVPLTIEEVGELAGKPIDDGWFWMTMEWHVKVCRTAHARLQPWRRMLTDFSLQHCAFAWRKLARSPVTGVTVERSTSGLAHIAHCENNFLRRNNLSTIMTRAGVALDADYQETRHMVEDDYWEIP